MTTQKNSQISYRQELDGLRAFAVLSVIIYHADLTWRGFNLLPGGFLGVDIFFVLSGFLITGILWEKDRSLWQFYKGRIDRIYPALLLMLFLSCLVIYKILMPSDLLATAESIKGSLGFYSNYVFMNEDAYVAETSKYKPFLHTWSLGVEWQFYMVFPLFIYFIKKYFYKNFDEILIALTVISFFYCLYLMNMDATKAFYSTPARIWELFAGGLSYLVSRKVKNNSFSSMLSSFGLALLVYSVFFFKDSDKHPGFVSLVAVLSTLLFITQTYSQSLAYRIFSWRPVVFIGVISYSLYLYHQPIQVFYRFYFGDFGNKKFLLLLGITFIFAYLSYRFFENPLRRSKKNSKYIVLFALAVAVFSFANGAVNTKGYPKRQPEEIRNALKHFEEREWWRAKGMEKGINYKGERVDVCNKRIPDTACTFGSGEKRLVLIGDSYAGVFSYSLSLEAKDFKFTTFENSQCPLTNSPIWFAKGAMECWEINKLRWKELENMQSSYILLGANFNQFYSAKKSVNNLIKNSNNLDEKITSEQVYKDYQQAIFRLIKLGHHPIILTQPPAPKADVKKDVTRLVQSGILKFVNSYGAEVNKQIEKDFKKFISEIEGAKYINTKSRLCDNKGCLRIDKSGGLYNSGSHLSYFGVQLFIPDILKIIE